MKLTEKAIKISLKLVDQGKFEEAREALHQWMAFLREDGDNEPMAKFKLFNAFACLENSDKNVAESLVWLEQAIECNTRNNLAGCDPLEARPAETYLNAANAAEFLLDHEKALYFAEMADRTAQMTSFSVHSSMH